MFSSLGCTSNHIVAKHIYDLTLAIALFAALLRQRCFIIHYMFTVVRYPMLGRQSFARDKGVLYSAKLNQINYCNLWSLTYALLSLSNNCAIVSIHSSISGRSIGISSQHFLISASLKHVFVKLVPHTYISLGVRDGMVSRTPHINFARMFVLSCQFAYGCHSQNVNNSQSRVPNDQMSLFVPNEIVSNGSMTHVTCFFIVSGAIHASGMGHFCGVSFC
jgi:hypothetical protein